MLATLAASALGLAIGRLILHALEELHEGFVGSWLVLMFAWLIGVMWLTFFFRLLGLWCFQSRFEPVPMSPQTAATTSPAPATIQ